MNKPSIHALTAICLSLGSAVAIADNGKPAGINYEHNGGNPRGMIQFKELAMGKPVTQFRCRWLRERSFTLFGQWNEGRWSNWQTIPTPFRPDTDDDYWEVEFRTTDGTEPPPPYFIDLSPKPFGSVTRKIKATIEIDYGPVGSGKEVRRIRSKSQ